MKTTGITILITGRATGIGLALAEVLLKENNRVIICGRRKETLLQAQVKLPKIQSKECDLFKEMERQELYDWVISNYPELNILVNNAGIQRQVDFTKGELDLTNGDDGIQINFSASVLLSAMFIPHLMKLEESAIVNISSGLGFVPLTIVPVYCATKAAIHSVGP